MNRRILMMQIMICAISSTVSAYAEDLEPVISGTGKTKFGALLQSWGVNDTTAATAKFNFRLRRAEIKFAGSLTDNARWFVMADAAKNLSAASDNKVVQDLGVAFMPSSAFEFVVGQFKAPTTAEGLESSAELLFPERSLTARTWGDRREPGAMLTYKEGAVKGFAAISNGQGTNVDDTTNAKDLHLRLEATPNDSVRVGAFTTAGDFNYGKKARWGANARLNMGDLFFRVEGVRANDVGVRSTGGFADLAYTINANFQPMARYEIVDNGTFKGKVGSFGLNYFLAKHGSKIQAAYSILDDVKGTSGAGSYGSTSLSRGASGTLLILAFQAAI